MRPVAALALVALLAACGGSDEAASARVTLGEAAPPTDPGPATITVVAPSTAPAPTTSSTTTSTTTTSTTTTTTTALPTTTSSTTTTALPTTTSSTTTTSTTTSTTVAPVDPIVVATPATGAVSTSCTSVAIIGDSTAVGLDGANGQLRAEETVVARLGDIGVESVQLDVSGGRSIVETLPGQTNGPQAMSQVVGTGFDGCWVILLGTNDAANIAAGSNADAATRVQRVIDAAGVRPILWVNASTVRTDGFWARPNSVTWNNELVALLAAQPTVALADWDAVASQNPWFVSDGIHPNADGLRARAQFVADSLRAFYPA